MKNFDTEIIRIYCKCTVCGNFFDVTNRRISKFCSKSCKNHNYYIKKKEKLEDCGV